LTSWLNCLRGSSIGGVKMTDKRMFTVCIEGNIGSGKTTLINHFSHNEKVYILKEPIEKWRNVRGHDIFHLMYTQPYRWAFPFETYVQLTRVELHKKSLPNNKSVKMIERSLYSSRYCFTENFYQNKVITDEEYTILDEWFKSLASSPALKVDLIVYLRTLPETVFERIRKRGRAGEAEISLEYLKELHRLHDEWLLGKSISSCPAPVLVVDAEMSLSEIYKEYQDKTDIILGEKILERNVNDSGNESNGHRMIKAVV